MTWQWLTLQDVLQPQSNRKLVQQGWSPKCHDYPADHSSWGVLKTTAIQPGRFEPEHNKQLPQDFAPRPQIEVQTGDLLMTCAGPRSRCGIPALVRSAPPRLLMSGKMYRFRPDDRILPTFLEQWLLSPDAQRAIDEMKTGISDSGLNLTHDRFLRLPVPVPPLDAQRRIVDVLEDHLSRLDAAEEQLTRCIARTGSVQNSWLSYHLSPTALPFTQVELGEVLVDIRGGWSRSRKDLVAPHEGTLYLKMNNLSRRGELLLDRVEYVRSDGESTRKYGVRSGDVLFNSKNSGDLIGKTVVADDRVEGAILNENIMRLRFAESVDPFFAGMYFMAPAMRTCITSAASASTNVSAVYQKDLIRFPIVVPDLDRQKRLVKEFAQMRDECRRLANQLDRQRTKSASLRRALRSAAFSGRLTSVSSERPASVYE